MKKLVIMLTALFTMTVSANAMSYEQARQQALFLTDKMAYELDLTEEQYEAAYEINLDYLMSVNSYDDLYGAYWTHRNLDMSYVLFDWQYTAYCAASYFYRPLYWEGGYWHFGIYARYPHRTYLYFGRPHFWVSYRGGHSWHHNGGRSWYHGRTFAPKHHNPAREHHVGMRTTHKLGDNGKNDINHRNDRNDRGNNHGIHNDRNRNNNNDTYRHGGNSETRRHDNNGNTRRHDNNSGDIRRHDNNSSSNNSRGFSTRESSTRTTATTPSNATDRSSRGFGAGSRSGSTTSGTTPNRSFRPSGSTESRSTSSFGGSRSTNRSSSFGGSRSSGSSSSFGGSRSSGSRSFGGGSRSGGSSGGGHGHFGGRR